MPPLGRPPWRLLVTGATGVVGSHVALLAAEQGHRVRVLVRRGSDRRALRGIDAEPVVGDVLDAGSLGAAVAGCDAVCHVAGVYDTGVGGAERMRRLHVDGTGNVLAAAQRSGVTRVVLTSSGITCAWGPRERPGTVWGDPQASARGFPGPLRDYYETKRAAEGLALGAAIGRGMDTVVVNPCFVLGARDVHETSGALITRLARMPLPIVPPGGNTFLTARDCARGHLAALARGEAGQRYLLAAWPLSYAAIAARILERLGRRGKPWVVPAPPLTALTALWGAAAGRWPLLASVLDPHTLSQLHTFRAWTEPRWRELVGADPEPIDGGIDEAIAWFRAEGRLR